MASGFLRIENFLNEPRITQIDSILRKFHRAWLVKYQEIYQKGAINSAYITNGEFLDASERLELLKTVGSQKVVSEAKKFLGDDLCFLNTQIFFNPLNESQKNYWHRDIQYTGQSEQEQRQTIEGRQSQVLHLRLALADERGIEFIPGSHFRWDSDQELEVRMQKNGKVSSDYLNGAQAVPLKRGDLLIFDANIIHRGLYGGDRFAFDMLFCKPLPAITQYRAENTLPKSDELKLLEVPKIFR